MPFTWPKDTTHPSTTKANPSSTHEEDVLVVEQIETELDKQPHHCQLIIDNNRKEVYQPY
jgi:hypothetical protein